VDVVRHDYEGVELETVFVAMMEERAMKSSALAVRWKCRCRWKANIVIA